MGGIEFGSGWYERLLIFRGNPKLFLDSRKMSKEVFCLDLLKDLFSDSIGVQYKIHLLLLIQEHTSFLLTDADLAEQTICSLQNLYHTLWNSEDKKLLKSQTLFALTTVLLSCESLDHRFSKLLNDTKVMILNAALTLQKDHLLASTSCQCLEEMEEFFPGILMDDIEKLWTFCQNCTSPSFQSYALLLSSLLKHVSVLRIKLFVEMKSLSLVGMEIHQILSCFWQDLYLPFHFGKKIERRNEELHENSSTDLESSIPVENEVPVLSIFAYLIDIIPLMTQASVYMMLKNLTVVVKNNSELQPMMFKPWISRLIVSSNVLYFHLAFDLLETFGDELFSSQEEQMLLHQLVSCTNHPSFRSSYKLLFLNWLGSSVSNKDMFSSNSSLSSTDAMFPFPFDGHLEQQQKLKLLAHYIVSKKKGSKYVQLLMNALSGLKNSALLPSGLSASTSLFRVLFSYCTLHSSQVLHSEIKKLILFLVTTSPHLASHCVSFLRCIKLHSVGRSLESGSDCSRLCEDILSKLVDHVISLPVKQFLNHVYDYLSILDAAAMEDPSLCKPKTLLRCLQNLWSQANALEEDGWMLGNSVLSVCHSLLKFQDIQLFCYDLCELLLLVLKNTSDVDVKLRAKTYYATVTFLSESKVKALFQNESYCKTTDDSLSSFIAGGEHTLRFRNTIQRLQKPILQLTRVKKKLIAPMNKGTDVSSSESQKGLFNVYKEFVSSESFQPVVQVPLILKHVNGCDEEFSTLYAVVIKIMTSPVPSKALDIEVPLLVQDKNDETDGVLVNAELTPSYPYPVTLMFNAEFTCCNGCSFTCDLPPITLEFEDLFVLIPIPSSVSPFQLSLKHMLFEEMWDYFRDEACKGMNLSSSCTAGLQLDVDIKDLTDFVMKNWEPFVFSRPPESSAFCVAIFLPPSCHLLMKISFVNNTPFVHILTDNWTILPWVNLYLNRLKLNFPISYEDNVSK